MEQKTKDALERIKENCRGYEFLGTDKTKTNDFTFIEAALTAKQDPAKAGEDKCVTGCKHFTGGEIKHHSDCPYYPESLSKIFDDMEAVNKQLVDALKDAQYALIEFEVPGAINDYVEQALAAAEKEGV